MSDRYNPFGLPYLDRPADTPNYAVDSRWPDQPSVAEAHRMGGLASTDQYSPATYAPFDAYDRAQQAQHRDEKQQQAVQRSADVARGLAGQQGPADIRPVVGGMKMADMAGDMFAPDDVLGATTLFNPVRIGRKAIPAAAGAILGSDTAEAAGRPRVPRGKAVMGGVVDVANWMPPDVPRASIVMPTAPLRAAGDTRASTRFPTGVGATENPLTHQLSIGTGEMMASPNFEYNIGLLSSYPGFGHLKDMTAPQAAREYVDQARGNLQYLYDRSPAVMRERSPHWYEGAHEISDALARRWGVPRPSSSAALASLSPQMDWFKNASLGERTGDILLGSAAGKKMTPEMETFARAASEKGFLKGDVNAQLLQRIRGKSLDQLDDPLDKALWIRLYDEAHNPRAYRTITPEGNFSEFVRNQGGEQAKVGWGALGEIQKAVRALESGGDMNIISPTLGSKHKVRSFYNNIENPNYPLFGDVTADTHQVAAAQMRPLSGASPAVAHNLASGGEAGAVNAKSSAVTGVQGLYGLTADATRAMARQNDLVPRAAQSATWEPVRELFPAKWKTAANAKAVDDIWRQVDAGRLDINQARDQIFNLAGGIGTPEWGRPGARSVAPAKGSTYR